MPIRLFHRTTRDAVPKILAEGFRDGEAGTVWFSRLLDCIGEGGPHLLEVMLDVSDDELEGYRKDATSPLRELSEEELERFETDGSLDVGCPVEILRWYEIPAAEVNARGSVRSITAKEEMMMERGDALPDDDPSAG